MDHENLQVFGPREAGPLPIIGVRRVIMQCRAHDDDRAAPAVAPGPEIPMASAFQPPTPEQGVFSGMGYRWIRGLLARNPCAIGIQPVHTRVETLWTPWNLPPRAIQTKVPDAGPSRDDLAPGRTRRARPSPACWRASAPRWRPSPPAGRSAGRSARSAAASTEARSHGDCVP